MNAVVRLSRSTVIDAPVDALWRLLRDFNGHGSWHPAIADSHIEAGETGDTVGSVRAFHLDDGSMLREQLVALSDRQRELTYCLLEGPIPLIDYVASMRLKPVTDGDRALLVWESRFRPPAERAAELSRLVAEGIYEAGFAALKKRFAGSRESAAPAPVRRPAQPPIEVIQPRAEAAPASVRGAIESQAIVVERYGGPEVLSPQIVRVPPPGLGEVRLRHSAIGVNFIDVYCRTGFLKLLKPPGVPGMEAAATVLDTGPGVTRLKPGDRVVYACEPVGAYAQYRNIDATLLVEIPSDIDDDTAAAIFLKGLSVEFLIHHVYPVRRDDTVLVHAAAGGMGLLLVQWAAALGAHVIGTTSSEQKAEHVLRAGAERAVIYTREDFVEAALRMTAGRGVDVVYDGVGADTFGHSLDALAIRGHLVSFGQASGPVGNWDIGAMASKSATVSRPNFGHYTTDPDELQQSAGRLFAAIRHGILTPTIDRRMPLMDAALAHGRLEGRQNIGALILIP